MEKLIEFDKYPVQPVLNLLLQDKTTKNNIIFATDTYESYGPGFSATDQITVEKILGFDEFEIQPRIMKSLEAQKLRTKVKAEVMTPAWIVCKMNNYLDEDWFEKDNVFNVQTETTWVINEELITFPEGKTWKDYIDSRRLEITCGEAPYIVSRYDTTTGECIQIGKRIGLLDRKLRIVNENADDEWMNWCIRAFQSVYGYEFQGDNLLIARINLLNTFVEYYENKFKSKPKNKELRMIANIIAWNFWQMDGFTGTIPFGEPEKEFITVVEDDVWAAAFAKPAEEKKNYTPNCKIYNWRRDNAFEYNSMKRSFGNEI